MQSCKTYSKVPVSFERAYESQQKVKIRRNHGLFLKKIKLSKIYFEDGVYYGRYELYKKVRIDTKQDVFYLRTEKINSFATVALVLGISASAVLLFFMIAIGLSGGIYI